MLETKTLNLYSEKEGTVVEFSLALEDEFDTIDGKEVNHRQVLIARHGEGENEETYRFSPNMTDDELSRMSSRGNVKSPAEPAEE